MTSVGHLDTAITEERLHSTPAIADHQVSNFHAVTRGVQWLIATHSHLLTSGGIAHGTRHCSEKQIKLGWTTNYTARYTMDILVVRILCKRRLGQRCLTEDNCERID